VIYVTDDAECHGWLSMEVKVKFPRRHATRAHPPTGRARNALAALHACVPLRAGTHVVRRRIVFAPGA